MLPDYLTIGSRSILACRETLVAGFCTRYLGSVPIGSLTKLDSDYTISVNRDNMPAGVSMFGSEAMPAQMVEFREPSLPELHQRALAMAWSDGAWDMIVTALGPLSGASLGVVTAARDYTQCEHILNYLFDAAKRGNLLTWMWRPMREGPPMRRKLHGHKDATLDAAGGRPGSPPEGLAIADWRWHGPHQWIIRLGQSAPEFAPKSSRPLRASGQ